MSESILDSIKASLGLATTHVAFDAEILMHLNSAIGTLTQLGVGPATGFSVADKTVVWSDFIGDDLTLNPVKTYIHLRVKMLYDPPDIGFVITAMKDQIKELESRINMLVDTELPPAPVVEIV